MTSSAVVSRYAHALVDVVLGPKGMEPKAALAQLREFSDVVQSNAALQNVLASPAVSAARKKEVIKRFAERLGTSPIVRNFLLVLSGHRRAAALPQVIDIFELTLDERMGFARAEVKSATELPEDRKQSLVAQLSKVAGKQVRARFAVEPALIGGVTAQIASTVYDGSVRGQLEVLRSRLALK